MPIYLKVSILYRTWSRSRNSIPAATWKALEFRQRRFLSASLLHILVPRCPADSVYWGKQISHCTHRGWGSVPSFRIMIVSSTCLCIKCSCRLVRLVDLLGKPSTRQSMEVAVYGKETRYSVGVGIGNGSSSEMDQPDRM